MAEAVRCVVAGVRDDLHPGAHGRTGRDGVGRAADELHARADVAEVDRAVPAEEATGIYRRLAKANPDIDYAIVDSVYVDESGKNTAPANVKREAKRWIKRLEKGGETR